VQNYFGELCSAVLQNFKSSGIATFRQQRCGKMRKRFLSLSVGGLYAGLKQYVEVSKYCEEHGLHSVWFADSQMLHWDVYASLAICSTLTNKIRFGIAVTNPVTRHYTVTGNALATLDEISSGRIILGIGKGDSSVRRVGLKPATLEELGEYVLNLRSLFTPKQADDTDGTGIWNRRCPPIYIAATGRKTLELAGKIADGVIINVGISERALSHAKELVGISASSSRGNPPILAALAFVSVSKDREKALASARPYVFWFIKNAPYLFRLNNLDADEVEREITDFRTNYLAYDFIHTAEWRKIAVDSELITDEMVKAFVVAGTPDDCITQIKKIFDCGMHMLIVRHTGTLADWMSFLKLYCEEIVPNVC
jgi:5,10-methylenetetrahydromethanopterin reductase